MQKFAKSSALCCGHDKMNSMTSIVPSTIDIEHWPASKETGPMTMLNAMQADTTSTTWSNRAQSVASLVAWWEKVSTYDPDVEPEYLITRTDLTDLSKEVLGVAAAHRVRPGVLAWDIPDKKEIAEWLTSSRARVMRQALEMQSDGAWWNRCLFEGTEERYYARTEHLVGALMADHPFVHMSNSLNTPLHEMLPLLDSAPSFFVPGHDVPGLPDLC